MDPESFGHTIENMFYVSFLVKDGHCRVFLDDDKLPVIGKGVQFLGLAREAVSRDYHNVVAIMTKKTPLSSNAILLPKRLIVVEMFVDQNVHT